MPKIIGTAKIFPFLFDLNTVKVDMLVSNEPLIFISKCHFFLHLLHLSIIFVIKTSKVICLWFEIDFLKVHFLKFSLLAQRKFGGIKVELFSNFFGNVFLSKT